MHRIVDEHEQMRDFRAQQEKAAEDRDAWEVEAEKRQAAYEAACRSALENQTTIPEAPQNPQAGHRAYQLRLGQIDAAKREWLEEHAAELLEQLLAREDEIVLRAAELVAELDGQTEELGTLLASVRQLHPLAVEPGGGARLDSPGSNFDLLLAAARTDTRVCRAPFAHEMGRRVGQQIYAGAR